MSLHNIQNQNLHLVESTDANTRLEWTAELHQLFLKAVSELGGLSKATPKSLMKAMGVRGLTLSQLGSHLQKHRMQSQIKENYFNNKQEDGDNESLRITQAWKLLSELQRKLQEKNEVQRYLLQRIEAREKYLETLLKKAQDILAGHNSSCVGVELAKTRLPHLVSMSVETLETNFAATYELPLMDMQPNNQDSRRKRSGSTVSDDFCVEQPQAKKSSSQKYSGKLHSIREYKKDNDSSPKIIDLNKSVFAIGCIPDEF